MCGAIEFSDEHNAIRVKRINADEFNNRVTNV